MHLSIHHVAIICSDIEAGKRFYIDILGCTLIRETHRAERQSWKVDLALHEGTQIELFSFPSPPPRVSAPEACGIRHLAFSVHNLDEALRELSRLNVLSEPIRVDALTHKRFTFIKDPDDLPIELYES